MVGEKGAPFVAGFLSVASPGSDMAVCRGTLNATKSSIRGEEGILPIMPLEMLRLLVFFSLLSEAPIALYLGFFALSSPLLPPPRVNFPYVCPSLSPSLSSLCIRAACVRLALHARYAGMEGLTGRSRGVDSEGRRF